MLPAFQRLRRDEGLHQAIVAIGAHEVVDGVLYMSIVVVPNFAFALFAWAISMALGVALGHWAVEKHNKLDRIMAKPNETETYLYE